MKFPLIAINNILPVVDVVGPLIFMFVYVNLISIKIKYMSARKCRIK